MSTIATRLALRLAYAYLDSNPEKNIPKLLDLVDRFDKKDMVVNQRKTARKALEDKSNNWYRYVMNVWRDVDPGVRKAFFRGFLINNSIVGWDVQEKLRKEHGCNIPYAILMDPTSACNLRCTGCWAAEYGGKHSLSYETLDSIIRQGKEMGVYFYLYSGGEPLIRKDDIMRLCRRHRDCVFGAFTNGTLIDERLADEMFRVKNFFPIISVEGFEEATDSRRGAGTYRAVMRAMDILRERKLAFGISCCYTSRNVESVGSEEFIDAMIEKGAKFAWFFTYIPVGASAVPELMVTPEQREFMYRQLRRFRETKPIFTLDFWNDGEYADGCIAGGRRYLHINAAGDIEPCAFIHYADSNIKEKTLLEALKSPLFMEYHKGQPFNGNMLRPCPLLDNPQCLEKMVRASGAKSTDFEHPEDVGALCGKCAAAAERWAPVADRLWRESGREVDGASGEECGGGKCREACRSA